MKIALAAGGFDPLHSGHISYLKASKKLADVLIVGLNSDEWLERKKGMPFMPWNERLSVVSSLSFVDEVFTFMDDDNSCKNFITQVRAHYPSDELIFTNGGDRTADNIPEMSVVDNNLTFVFGVGGDDKKNSSSWILSKWNQPTVDRDWGKYTILNSNNNWAVKRLEFGYNKSLSNQRHFKRSEHWHIVEGTIKMSMEFPNGDIVSKTYVSGESIDIPINTWHKATNVGNTSAKVIEVWMGSELSEEDIERRD